VAKEQGQFGILEAIPGARALLRWLGWCGLALLVIPAVGLAVLAESSDRIAQAGGVGLLLPGIGLLAVAAVGWVMVLMLRCLRRLAGHHQPHGFIAGVARLHLGAHDEHG